jgi:hypothetical protein
MSTHRSAPRFAALAAVAFALLPALAGAFTTIHPGIVADDELTRVYAGDRAGALHALDVDTGRSLWRSDGPAFPLGLIGDAVVALAPSGGTSDAVLRAWHAASGEVLGEARVALPPDVSLEFRPQPASRLETRVSTTTEGLRLDWHFRAWPLRGALLVGTDGAPDQSGRIEAAGAIAIRLVDGALVAAVLDDAPRPATFNARTVDPSERFAGATGEHFLAADDRAVAVSDEVPHPHLGYIQRLDLRSRSGEPIGTLESPYAWLPFIVREQLMLYRIGPVMTDLPGEGRVEHGSRLIAHDFATGKVRWSFDALERRYFGPQPP